MLFEAPAAGSLLAQMLGPSLSGARGRSPMQSAFRSVDGPPGRPQRVDRKAGHARFSRHGFAGGRSDRNAIYTGKICWALTRWIEEGVKAQSVQLVENGLLLNFLMSRRPGPDLDHTNGHGRSAFLGDPRPMISNLFFTSSTGSSPDDLKKKFLDACKQNGNKWCLIVREMDNPVLGVREQDDLSDIVMGAASGAATGDRLPLLVYRVNVDDGQESLVRGARLTGLTLRAIRNIAGSATMPRRSISCRASRPDLPERPWPRSAPPIPASPPP